MLTVQASSYMSAFKDEKKDPKIFTSAIVDDSPEAAAHVACR